MANIYQRWTDEHRLFVLDNWQSMSITEIGEKIGRTSAQVSSWLSAHDLRKNPKRKSPIKRAEPIPVKIIKNSTMLTAPELRRKKSVRHGQYVMAEIPESLINQVNARKAVMGTYKDRRTQS